MGTSGSSSDVGLEDIRSVFADLEEPTTPLTTSDVAERLDCTERTAERELQQFVESGRIETKPLTDSERVWWQPEGAAADDQQADATEFEAFVSAVRDYAIFTLDPDGTVASWNEGAERIKGYGEDDIVGEHFSAFYTAEDVEEDVPAENLEVARTEGRVEDEGWRVRADGSRFWANVVITAVRDDAGRLQGFTKVTRDMTERREYEQQLQRERDLTDQILDTTPVGIGVIGEDGQFVRANPEMLDRHGIDESDLAEYSLTELSVYDGGGDPIPADEWPWRRVVEDGESVYDFECQVDPPHGDRRWLSINAAPLDVGSQDDDRVVVGVDDITEQKERERQLRRERDQTEQLLRTAPVLVAVQNAAGETILANRWAQEALGLTEREIREDVADTDDWSAYDANGDSLDPDDMPYNRVIATGDPVFDEQLTIERPGDEPMQLRVNSVPILDEDGTVERVITVGEDVTELKRRERQLEQRKTELETELSDIFGRISDAFYALDDEWRFTHLNDRAAELLRRPRDDLLDSVLWDVFDDSAETYREQFETAMETQDPVTFEVYEDGIDTWLEFNVYPSESGLSIYFRDVTERKEREQELAKYETIVETVEDGIYVKGEDDRFTMVNEAYAELTGYNREELLGAHASLVVDEATITEAREREVYLDDDGTDPTMEAAVETADGECVPTAGTFATIETPDGDREQVGVVRDISDRKEYERKLEASNERLEQFAYAASHDLQEPLRMVSSYLQLIEQRHGDALDEDGREFLAFARDGAERMRAMIDGLLEYSRVETQGDPFEPVDLDAVLSDARADLQLQIEETGAEITADDLPDVAGDPDQLRQVFQNLLDNAIEYSGDDPPRIDVTAERNGREWVISVSDEGIGIDPDDADRIFEVFQRLHTHEEHAGTGIGLALCRRIVERHGGDIWVESDPGTGSTFSFTLPVRGETDA